MQSCHIDHVAITAGSLEKGVDYAQSVLGAPLQRGGEHPLMGTHNYLLKLGQESYLEVIAVNPQAPSPNRPRWFGLDNLPDEGRPRMATWILRVDDVESAVRRSPIPLGSVTPMSRGDLNWLITIPDDGSLPMDGVAPTLIEWKTPTHPAAAMQDTGCFLVKLEGFHPEAERITGMLDAIGFDGDFSVSPIDSGSKPYIIAHVHTPSGTKIF